MEPRATIEDIVIVRHQAIQEESIAYKVAHYDNAEWRVAVCVDKGKKFYNIANYSARSIPVGSVTATKLGEFALKHPELGIDDCFLSAPLAGNMAGLLREFHEARQPAYTDGISELEGLYIHSPNINSVEDAVQHQLRLENAYSEMLSETSAAPIDPAAKPWPEN